MASLRISNLKKTYPNGVKALDDISLYIPQGMYGLLGPNGAGKSTFMRTIATLQDPDEGSIIFGDLDLLENKSTIRKHLGYLPQQFGLYPKITAEALLHHLAVLKGITNKTQRQTLVTGLLHKTNLYEVRKQKLGGFSGGMKQRFGIAQALLNNPKLLLVDEPTAGLDPAERNRFYNILSELSESTIVILSSHIVDDIKELCTQMAIINKGQVLSVGNPIELINSLRGKIYHKTITKAELPTHLDKYELISSKLYVGRPIIRIISDLHPSDGFQPAEPNLEDVYFSQLNSKGALHNH